MMTKAELLIRSLLGPRRGDIRPLVYSVETAMDLMFVQNRDWEEVNVTKDLYPQVAKRLKKGSGAVTRSVERLANHCWNALDEEQVLQLIGKPLRDIRAPSDMIFYLAFYVQYNKPFYQMLREEYILLFPSET